MKFNNRPYGMMVTELIRHKADIKERFNKQPEGDTVEDYLTDKILNENVWYLTKMLINWAYADLGGPSRFQVSHYNMIANYTKGMFDMLIEMLPAFVQEIDVDTIYITHYDVEFVSNIVHHVLDKVGLPYEVTKI